MREAVFRSIPLVLKEAISAGIGLFICFIGLQNAHIVVDSPTLVSLFSFRDSLIQESFWTEGICVLLSMAGILITGIFLILKIKGGILWGILLTWGLGILCQLLGLYVPDAANGFYSLVPSTLLSMPASIAPTFLQLDFSSIASLNFLTVMLAFLFVDMFDTLGAIIGCAASADLLDENGNLPEAGRVMLSDAIGTTAGALLGTSTITTFAESSAGIAEGGRTGLTAIVTGILFLVALFFSPLFLSVPAFATAPSLVIVGYLMVKQMARIDWRNGDAADLIPAFITISTMPFLYSISEGISLGVISYTLLHTLTGRWKKVSPVMYVLTVVFILKYAFWAV